MKYEEILIDKLNEHNEIFYDEEFKRRIKQARMERASPMPQRLVMYFDYYCKTYGFDEVNPEEISEIDTFKLWWYLSLNYEEFFPERE